jgi:hypothetical protein
MQPQNRSIFKSPWQLDWVGDREKRGYSRFRILSRGEKKKRSGTKGTNGGNV